VEVNERTLIGELRNWRKHICGADGTFVIWGHVYGDTLNRFPDGNYIHTSAVSAIEGNKAVTNNGHVYVLIGEADGPEVNSFCF